MTAHNSYVPDRFTKGVHPTWLLFTCIATAAAPLVLYGRLLWGFPFERWLFALPSVPLGLALGRMLSRPWPEGRLAWLLTLAISLVTIGVNLGLGIGISAEALEFRYALAMGLLSAGVLMPRFGEKWSARLPPLMIGAYILHSIAYWQFVNRIERVAHYQLGYVAKPLTAVALTFVLVAFMRRTRLRAII